MPIGHMQYEDGLFYTQVNDHFDREDAETWMTTLHQLSEAHPTLIEVIVDFGGATFVSAGARIRLADATRLRQVSNLIFIATDMPMLQTVRMIGMLGERGRTHAFTSSDEALKFAWQQRSAGV